MLRVSVGSVALEPAIPNYLRVVEIVLHHQYKFVYNADIALLRLQKRAELGDYVRPLCVDYGYSQISRDSICYTAGWGVTSVGGQ